MTGDDAKWRVIGAALAVYAVITGVLTWLVFQAAGGTLGYTLDDPYIHLSVAANLVETGTYGVNPGEVAAPSSSILWPLLLVPFVALGLDPGIAFVLNVLCAVVAIAVVGRIASRTFSTVPIAVLVTVAWMLATNVLGVPFTGMEHTLQLALAVLAAFGAGRVLWRGEVDGWLWVVLVLGPLVRYESMAISVPLLVWLFLRGNRTGAVATGAAIIASLGAFSGFLLSHDIGPLPSSVVAKSLHIEENGGALMGFVGNLLHNMLDWAGARLLLLSFVAIGAGLGADARERKWLGFAAAAGGFLHLIFGRLGWFYRYEVYVVAYLYVSVLVVAGPQLREWCGESTARATAVAAFVVAVGWTYVYALPLVPDASANIWGQQHQLHRLVADHVDEPVGVNDLGWTTYGNDDYVYDFLGLGSHRSIEHLRNDDPTKTWMDEAAADHDIRLLVVSDFFFPDTPDEWVKLGELCLDVRAVTVAIPRVTVFARRPEFVDDLRPKITAWAKDLPDIARFEPDGCRARQ